MPRIIGIDLGTTNSCVAVLDDKGQPRILAGADGERIIPSWVSWSAFHDAQAEGFRTGHLYLREKPSPALVALSDPMNPDLKSLLKVPISPELKAACNRSSVSLSASSVRFRSVMS